MGKKIKKNFSNEKKKGGAKQDVCHPCSVFRQNHLKNVLLPGQIIIRIEICIDILASCREIG